MIEVPDQRAIWDQKHANGDHDILRGVPSPLTEIAIEYIAPNSQVLELGCGVGRDALFLAEQGNQVLATDGSKTVIEQNRTLITHPNLIFDNIDIKQKLPYDPANFDAVYANLSLHYFSDRVTRKIVADITRVLRTNGVFAFACKSYDSLHNAGQEIEPNVFVSPTGATIHLFSLGYTKSLLGKAMSIEYLDEIDEDFNGRQSKIIRCIARKK